MKQFPRKLLVLLTAVALLLTFAVSGTVAYLVVGPQEVENTFTPVQVNTRIVETFEKGSKSSIMVQNGDTAKDIPVYVRVAVVGNWVDAEGKIVGPWSLGSYNTANWTKSGEFYYYNSILPVGKVTEDLLTGNGIREADYSDAPEGTHLVVTVVQQAIQAAGMPATVDSAQDAFEYAASSTQ